LRSPEAVTIPSGGKVESQSSRPRQYAFERLNSELLDITFSSCGSLEQLGSWEHEMIAENLIGAVILLVTGGFLILRPEKVAAASIRQYEKSIDLLRKKPWMFRVAGAFFVFVATLMIVDAVRHMRK
jgi:hypothetical protein